MEENMNGEKSKNEIIKSAPSVKKNVFIIILLVAVIGLAALLIYKDVFQKDDCQKKLSEQELTFNNTIVGIAQYVQNNVTITLVNQIYEATEDCNVIAVHSDNSTRQLADVVCIDKAVRAVLEQQKNMTQ